MDEFDEDDLEIEERQEKGYDRVVGFREKRPATSGGEYSILGPLIYGMVVWGVILFVAAAVLKWAWGVLFGG